ncbi:hypothetical protein SDC9_18207 [bioreactor metagenome]|jgi:hypothetical protein|uniref:DUF4834 domain-containing protein n=1 Tax=bioreactor metagenome TaxID=1076179 RepID=A0A644U1U7_9ZZZZ|nr:DUF4834 family protein [Bacteroidales bacterium]WRQ33960.1 DUF4834 family protein [Bacteroidales bacterium MB20-C3-3]MBP6454196.1 DUF4834 family protein [Bacteroidales bacterium]MBP8677657.1 DUF4834 family protein [Bacteroidales bacterium]MBP9584562.1 DUF4834 family protein [Bacteroidales bacterium]
MEGFITFIFIAALIIFILSRVAPLLLAWWVRKKISNLSGGQDPFREADKNDGRKISEVDGTIISDQVERDKIVDSDVGEYVDFEESKK